MVRKLLLSMLICACTCALSFAQDIRQKLGKPSDYELQMTDFPADTSAAAVVLWQNVRIFYEIDLEREDTFTVTYEREMRIKVLRSEGAEAGNVVIPYFNRGQTKESVRVTNAAAYNLVNGKVVKSDLQRKDVYDEQVSEATYLKKFSIPEVRVGTVVEYKYTLTSNIASNIREVEIQGDYPVLNVSGSITIPTIFRYNVSTKGYYPIRLDRASGKVNVKAGGNTIPELEMAETLTFSAKDIPALKPEKDTWVWCADDFRSGVNVEISALQIPHQPAQNFSTTWASINNNLSTGDFGRNLGMSCPYADEVKKMAAETESDNELVRKILKLVTSRVKWDNKFRLSSDNVRRAVRDGSGSSAEVNFILNSALRAAGFKTTPVLLNPRHYGRMPLAHPTLDKINAFVIAVELEDGSLVVVDATDSDNDVNVIFPTLMVDRARLYGVDDSGAGWVDLSNPSFNYTRSFVSCDFDEDLNAAAKVTTTCSNMTAMLLKKRYRSATSEEEFIENMEKRSGIEVENYEISDMELKDVTETYSFRKESGGGADLLYLNATIFPFMSESIFKEQQRDLPVEFPYKEAHELTCLIKVPEGYQVEELPQAEQFSLDTDIIFRYTATVQQGGIIECKLQYVVNRLIYSVEEYPTLFELYGRIAAKSNSNIVLKKIG